MEEERCAFGAVRANGTEPLAASAAQAASQHPTVHADTVVMPDSEQSQGDQQTCDDLPTLSARGPLNGVVSGSRPPTLPLQSSQASLLTDQEASEESMLRSLTAASGSCAGAEAPTASRPHGEAAMEVEAQDNRNGDLGPEPLDVGPVPNGVAKAVNEAVAVEGSGGVTAETVALGAVGDDTGDAGGAESDGKESNDSICNECGGGGEVVCCDGCVKSYHADCLPVVARPRLRANADDWYCPECASAAAAPSAAAASSPGNPKPATGLPDSRFVRQNAAPVPPSPIYHPTAPAVSWPSMPSCVPTRRRKTKATEDYETRINVGPNHQVPHLPDFFLARGESDSLSTIAEQSLADGAQSQALGPLLVYSPYLMERSKQQCLAERASKSCINSQKDLAEFLIKCSKRWKVRPGWQPFSPEFAYKLLHRANYDPERALRMMDDSAFCFQSVCDPPLRKYENKWKRRDKRGTFPSSPYPPPVVVRGYLNEKQRQLRMGR
ncbi:uncharacterized protein LOC34619841 [Cyclospora cayetanensis]|nr:uncharacterized protein LOC34619841 [Cyclospora cayetanensis]